MKKRNLLLMVIIILFLLFLLLTWPPSSTFGADCEKAKGYFKQARRLNNDTPNLINKEQLYRKAIELCPSYAEAHNNLGDVYEKLGRFEEAIAQYKKTIELKPSAPYPYFGLGDIYYKTGRYKEAKEWYEKGLKRDPNDELTRKTLALLNDIQKGGVIKAETIRGMLSTTRGAGEIVSITFGEGMIPFDFDKYDIRSDAKPQLNEIGRALKDILPSSKDILIEESEVPLIEIAGHTDCRGTDEYNLNLSRKRAESVEDYLVRNFNIPKERLKAEGHGERVPLASAKDCTKNSKEEAAGHALNRRVEIVKKTVQVKTERGVTRTILRNTPSFRGSNEPQLIVETVFFSQKSDEKLVKILKEDSRLRSRSDKYFIFFRPLQDCYVYIIQEDAKGKISLLFPDKDRDAYVKVHKDYWIPSFGNSYTLDDAKGEEKIYLLVTSWQIKTEVEGLTLKDAAMDTVRSVKTRIIKVVPASAPVGTITEEELKTKPQKIESIIERIEGEGGWVKVVKFWHE